jgi:2,3-bisphosphoglycerate-independent phosphoglycerate mutase
MSLKRKGTEMQNRPTALVILDGFGYKEEEEHNAIAQASMPHFNQLLSTYPATILKSAGTSVGLPEGYNGNSEVGHLTIGCGKIIKQPLTQIEDAIADKSFYSKKSLIQSFERLKKNKKTLHIMGLLSDGGVHSSIKHLFAFLDVAHQQQLTNIVIHPFLDGRDVAPHSAHVYLEQLETKLKELNIGSIGTLHGRFYAMDRNRNWQHTQKSYQVLTQPQPYTTSWKEALEKTYDKKLSEEFLHPVALEKNKYVKKGDGVICFNFRADRARQLTSYLLDKDDTKEKLAFFITPVGYGSNYKTTVLFEKTEIPHTLTQFLHDHGNSIFTIAETEKYAHVSYFFNGGREEKLEHETRILVPSITRKKYDIHPEMSANTITEAVVDSLRYNPHDFYVINYANADMVAHTGNFKATLQALECLDKQIGILVEEVVKKRNGILYITSDHGNAEEMYDSATQTEKTSHTTNPVFFIMAAKDVENINLELPITQLSDIAPFVAQIMLEGLQTSLR